MMPLMSWRGGGHRVRRSVEVGCEGAMEVCAELLNRTALARVQSGEPILAAGTAKCTPVTPSSHPLEQHPELRVIPTDPINRDPEHNTPVLLQTVHRLLRCSEKRAQVNALERRLRDIDDGEGAGAVGSGL